MFKAMGQGFPWGGLAPWCSSDCSRRNQNCTPICTYRAWPGMGKVGSKRRGFVLFCFLPKFERLAARNKTEMPPRNGPVNEMLSPELF